jgi:hypothetical protein
MDLCEALSLRCLEQMQAQDRVPHHSTAAALSPLCREFVNDKNGSVILGAAVGAASRSMKATGSDWAWQDRGTGKMHGTDQVGQGAFSPDAFFWEANFSRVSLTGTHPCSPAASHSDHECSGQLPFTMPPKWCHSVGCLRLRELSLLQEGFWKPPHFRSALLWRSGNYLQRHAASASSTASIKHQDGTVGGQNHGAESSLAYFNVTVCSTMRTRTGLEIKSHGRAGTWPCPH